MSEQFADKVRNKKRKRTITTAVLLAILLLIAGSLLWYHFGGKGGAGGDTVTVEIRCDALSEDMSQLNDPGLADYVPEDGAILSETKIPVTPGESTVLDATEKACKDNDVQIEYSSTPGYGGYYVEGIGYLYEFSAGKYSGWIYSVDGEEPNYSADKVTLEGGEKIVWNYTVDYRK